MIISEKIVVLFVSLLMISTIFTITIPEKASGGTDVLVDEPLNPPPPVRVLQNEVSLTLMPGPIPGQPALLLAAYNDNPQTTGGNGLGYSYSTDGGANWTNAQLPFPTYPNPNPPSPTNPFPFLTMVNAFDPTTTVDTQGNVYIGQIATDGNLFGGTYVGYNGLFVDKASYSQTTGFNYIQSTQVALDQPSTPPVSPPIAPWQDSTYRFNDRCQMTADIDPNSPYTDNLYISWIKDRGLNMGDPYSDIYFAYSTDLGNNFNLATGTSTNFPGRINDENANRDYANIPIPAVASDGTVYVTWLDTNVSIRSGATGRIYLDKSTDGGVTWGNDTFVRQINLPPRMLRNFSNGTTTRSFGGPVPAVSPNRPNEIYITYAADPDGNGTDEADIFFIRTTDGGSSWSAPLRINDDSTRADQHLPWMDVKPDGTIDIAWYDRRADGVDVNWDVYIARSTDGGRTFTPNVKLTDQNFATSGGNWMGEYLGLAVDSDYAYLAWTSSITDSNGDIYFDKINNSDIKYPQQRLQLRLNENSGYTAFDSSGNNNDASFGDNATPDSKDPVWTSGIEGGGLKFDGVDDYITIPDSNSLDISGPMTVSAWVKTLARTGNIVDKNGFGYSGGAFSFYIGYGGNLRFHIDNGTWLNILQSDTLVNNGKWRHVAATWDGSFMRLYIDGIEDKKMSYPGPLTPNNLNLSIGAKLPYFHDWFLNGTLDEINLWNRSLSAAEIMDNYRHLAPVHNINSDNYYTTIGDAVSAAGSGDTIEAARGTYNERVSINQNLIVKGAGSGVSVIDGGGNGNVVQFSNANGGQIQGFTIRNSNSTGAGVRADNNNGLIIRNNLITGNYEGIKLKSCSNYNISGNSITNNTNANVNIDPSFNGRVTNNIITYSYYGIYIDASSPLIKDNLIQNNVYGIFINSGAPVIGSNTMLDNKADVHYFSWDLIIHPGKINLKSRGKWLTAIIEPPVPLNLKAVDLSSLRITDIGGVTANIQAEPRPTAIGDFNGNGINGLMVKFSRSKFNKVGIGVGPCNHPVTVSGLAAGGLPISATGMVKLM